jgi:hypothetical protein
MLEEARYESDPEVRKQMYADIEDAYFGYEGDFPFIPIFLRIAFTAEHSWLERDLALFGGQQWYTWTIDADAQAAAQD